MSTSDPSLVIVRFVGGPWDGLSSTVQHVTTPVFSTLDAVGKRYHLNANSTSPEYVWRGSTSDTVH